MLAFTSLTKSMLLLARLLLVYRWNQDFELLVHEPDHQKLTAVLLEHHPLDKDDEVGRVSIPIDQLPVGETQDVWLDLGPPGSADSNSLLSLSVSALHFTAFQPLHCSKQLPVLSYVCYTGGSCKEATCLGLT